MRIRSLTQSVFADDPRVRRQVETLRDAGHDVSVVAYSGGRSALPELPMTLLDPPSRSGGAKVGMAVRMLGERAVRRDPWATFASLAGQHEFASASAAEPADLYLANDWRALPAAVGAVRRHGGRFAYDTHEWAVEEFVERRSWRAVFPPLIDAIERRSIGDAAFVTTVGPGIARLLQQRYGLAVEPTVVRNVPWYQEQPFREPGRPVRVLYHGQFLPNLGLEPLVASVADWRPELRLELRGFGPGDYEAQLRAAAAASPAADRITFLGRAAMTELVGLANQADVGIHPLQAVSNQTRYSLPNKLFEYLMAGLAVCVSDLPDMADIVQHYDVGTVIAEPTPAGIAAAVNALDLDHLADAKRRALVAARELCWERESQRLVELVGALPPS